MRVLIPLTSAGIILLKMEREIPRAPYPDVEATAPQETLTPGERRSVKDAKRIIGNHLTRTILIVSAVLAGVGAAAVEKSDSFDPLASSAGSANHLVLNNLHRAYDQLIDELPGIKNGVPEVEAAGCLCPDGQTPKLTFTLDNPPPNNDPPGILKLFCGTDTTPKASWRVSSGDNIPANDQKPNGPLPRGTWTVLQRTVSHPDTNHYGIHCQDKRYTTRVWSDWYPLTGTEPANRDGCYYIHASNCSHPNPPVECDVPTWKKSSSGCLAIQPPRWTYYDDFKSIIDSCLYANGAISLEVNYGDSLSPDSLSDQTVDSSESSLGEACPACEDVGCPSVGGVAELPDVQASSQNIDSQQSKDKTIPIATGLAAAAGALGAGGALLYIRKNRSA